MPKRQPMSFFSCDISLLGLENVCAIVMMALKQVRNGYESASSHIVSRRIQHCTHLIRGRASITK